MKKGVLSLLLVTLLVSSLLVGIISAQSSGSNNAGEKVKTAIDGIVQVIDPITSLILGESYQAGAEGGASPYFFVKILFFIIVLSIVWIAMSRIEIFYDYPWVLWLVSIAVAILGMKFIVSPDWLSTILLPYGTLAIAISAGLPFVIYFIVVNFGMPGPTYKTFRRMAWIFFGVIFAFLWLTRTDLGSSAWIYPITALLCLVMILFDGTFQRIMRSIRTDKAGAASAQEAEERLLERMGRIDGLLARGTLTPAEAHARKVKIRKQIEALWK